MDCVLFLLLLHLLLILHTYSIETSAHAASSIPTISAVPPTWSTFSCIFSRPPLFPPFTFESKKGLLLDTRSCFQSQWGYFQEASWISFPNIWCEPVWRPDRNPFGLQGTTHAHMDSCPYAQLWKHCNQLCRVSSLNTHTQLVYFALPQDSRIKAHTHALRLCLSMCSACMMRVWTDPQTCLYSRLPWYDHSCFMLFSVHRWNATLYEVKKTWTLFSSICRCCCPHVLVSYCRFKLITSWLSRKSFNSLNKTGHLSIFLCDWFRIRCRERGKGSGGLSIVFLWCGYNSATWVTS